MSDKILESLNEKQKEAVTHFKGPLVIIAGAGSGKTRALTHRVAYLIKHHGLSPWNILAVTFTNKAASEMKERIKQLLNTEEESDMPLACTFHSLCVRILRKHIHLLDYENSFTIYDGADQQVLMKRLMAELHIDPKQINPRALLNHISNAKNELMDHEQYNAMVGNYFTQRVAEVFGPYQAALRTNNALDFDDLIMKTAELFQKHPDVLDYYQEKFKFINIDEYQDTNHAQYMIVKMLAEKYRNICVIGDSDQSIYSWRGADIRNILDFEKDYKDAKIIKMEQNYRSTQKILDAAHEIIVKNRKRVDKKLWTDRKGGENIKLFVTNNERQEGELIASTIREMTADSEAPPYGEFVVLYRTNAQSRIFEEVFLRHGIPYRIIGGIKFYERKEIKDMVAYLRTIVNPHDTVSLLRIINVPARKIGSKTIEKLNEFAKRHSLSLFEAMENVIKATDDAGAKGGKAKELKKFVNIIKSLREANKEFPASGVIKHALEVTGYKDFVLDGTVEGEARYENLMELVTVASKYDNLEVGLSLSTFLEEISLIADIDTLDDKENGVVLMTIHAAKGLEFNNVFIAGLEEGIFPHSRSMTEPDQLEEERRLMYVAVTRAKETLHLLYAKQRMLYGEMQANAPSPFIADIPEEMITVEGKRPRIHVPISSFNTTPVPVEDEAFEVNFVQGDKVLHHTFGRGMIVNVKGNVATVAFEDPGVGIKKLALSVAPLEKIFD